VGIAHRKKEQGIRKESTQELRDSGTKELLKMNDMEQQIRNEKFREIELKKSMFNVKMFSLMKKQLFSLVMMLALVVLAGTSAWAQSGTLTNPIIQINGSAHTLHVDAHGTNTYSWVTSATIVDDFTSYTGNDTRTLSYTWSETATGSFTFDVTETDPSETCKTTTRRIHVLVIDFDIIAYWSTGGANIEADAAQMNACSEGTEANYGDDPANLAFGQEIDLGNTGSVAGDLSTMVGTAPMTEREITLEIQWNLGTSSFDPAGLVGSIGFTYSFDITNENGTFVSFNGIATNQNGTTYVDGDADADGADGPRAGAGGGTGEEDGVRRTGQHGRRSKEA